MRRRHARQISVPTRVAVSSTNVSPPPATSRRVVVIEDDRDAGQALVEVLELEGHQVSLAADGLSGVALAQALKPDVVLCDIGLPDMDGFKVAKMLRDDASLAATRLVALSGYGQAEDRTRAREAGFDLHLTKPPSLEALQRALLPRPTE
jgi:two-component system CheB/CheR fusion protein